MKNTFAKMFTVCALAGVLCFALSACDDSSSAGGEGGSGGNRGGIPDTVETFMELSDYDCGKSQKCVATYLTEYHDMAVCDGNNGWVIGTLIEKMDCDFSSSSDKSSDSKSNEPAEVTDDSSDSKGNPSSAGTSTKSSNSNTSGNDAKSSSSSAGKVNGLATPCKTETEDNCEHGELVDERDGQTYKTVKIGDQWWMAENLNYADSVTTTSLKGRSWCYDNDPANCTKYGRLYTWAAAIDSVMLATDADNPQVCGYYKFTCTLPYKVQGICDKGWHLPSYGEWMELIVRVGGGASTAGKVFKSQSGWNVDGNGTDAYGFSALPAGGRGRDDLFGNRGCVGFFWGSGENDYRDAFLMQLDCTDDKADVTSRPKSYAYSVRCVKDSD